MHPLNFVAMTRVATTTDEREVLHRFELHHARLHERRAARRARRRRAVLWIRTMRPRRTVRDVAIAPR